MTFFAPEITPEDRRRVFEALADTQIAYGPTAEEFERKIASTVEKRKGLATSSGTAALHLALLAVGVQPGDLVLVPSLTFIAPANAARYVEAEPLLFDSEPIYRQLDVGRLGAWLEEECDQQDGGAIHSASGRRIGAIVPVDLLGHPCDVGALAEFAKPRHIPIVEDGAQALGATHRGRPIGAYADVLCLSFNANKIITTGGGGMLLSDNGELVDRARLLANQAKVSNDEYLHEEIGFNYRMPSIQAALGLSQFSRLDELVERKRGVGRRYERSLAGVPGLTMPAVAPEATATGWLFAIQVETEEFGLSARTLRKSLREREQIETRPMFTPLHARGVHAGRGAQDCGVAEHLGTTGVILPSSLGVGDEEADRICEALLACGR
jgi:perosamine synthetase